MIEPVVACVPFQDPVAVQLVTLRPVHLRVTEPPEAIEVRFDENVRAGRLAFCNVAFCVVRVFCVLNITVVSVEVVSVTVPVFKSVRVCGPTEPTGSRLWAD